MIRRPRPQWKDREHLFTPSNITKFEFACCRDCVYKKRAAGKRKEPKGLNGPCIWIMKDGRLLDFTTNINEEAMIEKGPQLNEDRSGEPNYFTLEG